MFDELSVEEVPFYLIKVRTTVLKVKNEHPAKIVNTLLETALTVASQKTDYSYEDLRQKPPGKEKRNLHDDMTLLYVNLSGQVS